MLTGAGKAGEKIMIDIRGFGKFEGIFWGVGMMLCTNIYTFLSHYAEFTAKFCRQY